MKGFKKDQPITVVAARPGVWQPQTIRNPYLLPSEAESESFEGGRITVQVSRFERDPVARKRCIQIFGANCVVCGFDFTKTYGKIGAGFIHVHHLRPVSAIGKKYRVNARRDLRPVCPNYHEMLHRKNPPFSTKELAARISKLKGGTMLGFGSSA
jgi:5-methylcytosine-specific restriction enzyme A